MSELNVDALASAEEVKTARAKKIQTAEERAQLVEASETLQMAGIVSGDFVKVLPLMVDWNSETEELKAVKDAVIAEFGGSDKFKDFVGGEFTAIQDKLNAISRLVVAGNGVKSHYTRRNTPRKGKVKTTTIFLNNMAHSVSVEYLASLAGISDAVEKRNLLLAHADTTKIEGIESL